MTPERWERIENLYHAALAREPATREKFLAEACAGDEELRREVESLLAEQSEAEGFIESPAIDLAARELATEMTELGAGRMLGPYTILSLIGEGGMGEVYRATDSRLGRTVAIKTLPAMGKDPERNRRFLHEARIASSLSHPNVAHIYDIGEFSGVVFIAMEMVEGQTLSALGSGFPLEEDRVIDIAIQVADVLDAAHSRGIIHRDIKPSNIMLTARGQVKVLDFGIAKLAEPSGSSPNTATGLVMGTLDYMSPEQALGRELDARTDLFSLGIVLYEIAAGRRPFSSASQAATIDSVLHHDPEPAARWNSKLSSELPQIIRKCLEKDREKRYPSARELLFELQSLQRSRITGAVRLDEGKPRRHAWWRRTSIVLTAVLIVGLLIPFGWRAWKRRPADAGGGRLSLLVSAETSLDEPDLSPDNKMIVYTGEENGQTDLFLARVAGGSRVRLTNDKAVEGKPGFSPDGERILFTRLDESSLNPDVVTIPTLGGDATPILHDAFDAVWSPDGRRLAYVRTGPPQTLAISAADGGQERILLPPDAGYPFLRNPSWSPDATQVAIERSNGGAAGETWLIPLNGTSPRKLTRDAPGAYSHYPKFMPDGRNVVDSSNRGGSTNLWKIPLDGSAPLRLTTGPGPDASPAVSRSGSIVFSNSRTRTSLLIHEFATGVNREILTHPFSLWGPAFSPDGHDLAFSRSEAAGLWHIWTIPVGGGPPRQVTSGAVPEIYPRFLSDNSGLTYHTWTTGADRIWRVPRTGGTPAALTPTRADDDSYGEVSPDGRLLAFARTEGESTRIWLTPLDGVQGGNPAHRLLDMASTLPRWSPDGRWIAFSPSRDHQAGVFVVRADGTGLHQLSETGSWPVWWPDGERVGYIASGPNGNQQIYTVPFSGGKPTAFTGVHFRGANSPFDISRDGSLLATSNTVILTAEIWALELPR